MNVRAMTRIVTTILMIRRPGARFRDSEPVAASVAAWPSGRPSARPGPEAQAVELEIVGLCLPSDRTRASGSSTSSSSTVLSPPAARAAAARLSPPAEAVRCRRPLRGPGAARLRLTGTVRVRRRIRVTSHGHYLRRRASAPASKSSSSRRGTSRILVT